MKKIFLILLIPILLTNWSCKKYVEGYDVSPNSPSKVTPALLLTTSEVSTFQTHTGQLARFGDLFAQQFAGVQGQFQDYAVYNVGEGDVSDIWAAIYNTGILNLVQLKYQAGSGNPYYQGMSDVLQAMNYGVATDLWGDIPLIKDWNGLDASKLNFNPVYSDQKDVYDYIFSLLNEGITLLSKNPSDNKLIPGSDDLIFGGDVAKWKQSAYILLARYHNHLSQIDPAGSATDALAALSSATLDPSNDMNAVFGGAANELNQYYAFNNARDYMRLSAVLVDTMKAISDPRLSFYALPSTNGSIRGTELGTDDDSSSDIGPYLATADKPIVMAGYVEAKFIEAEANLRLGNTAKAAAAYNDAVIASVKQVTGADPDVAWKTLYASATTVTLRQIMWAKWIATYGQIEAYNDWRRTGYPELKPDPRAAISSIPLRLPTSISERLYNKNARVQDDITVPVWWDR